MTKKHIEFLLSEHALTVVHVEHQLYTIVGSIQFHRMKEFQVKEAIQAFLTEHSIDESSYDEFSLSWYSPLSTLVPMNIFGASSAKEIFNACFTQNIASNDIDYNRISELSIVNIYEIPLWVKSFFVIRFPRIVLQHENTYFLRGIFSGAAFTLSLHLQIHKEHFTLSIVQHNNLLFHNTFEMAHENDIIYYLTFTLQQQNLSQKEGNLYLYQLEDNTQIDFQQLTSTIEKINDLAQYKLVDTKTLPYKYQQLCV